jgi:hypothetical protein
MAADHGVTVEGVSAYPSSVTAEMVLNFVRGGASINVLARLARADVVIVDIGVAAELSAEVPVVHRKAKVKVKSRASWRWCWISFTSATRILLRPIDHLRLRCGHGRGRTLRPVGGKLR